MKSICPKKQVKPISIYFDVLTGETGMTLNPETNYHATISVSIRMDKSSVEKYIKKQLTIKDLNDMINGSK